MIVVLDMVMYIPISGVDIPTMILFMEFMRRMCRIVRLFVK